MSAGDAFAADGVTLSGCRARRGKGPQADRALEKPIELGAEGAKRTERKSLRQKDKVRLLSAGVFVFWRVARGAIRYFFYFRHRPEERKKYGKAI